MQRNLVEPCLITMNCADGDHGWTVMSSLAKHWPVSQCHLGDWHSNQSSSELSKTIFNRYMQLNRLRFKPFSAQNNQEHWKQAVRLAFNAITQHNKISKAQKASRLVTIVKNPSGHYSLDKNWSRIHLAKQKKINLPYSRKEMVDSLCAKWNSMRESSPDHNQLSLEQFRDLARTETDDELFRDCCNSAKKEGITLSEFMTRYV